MKTRVSENEEFWHIRCNDWAFFAESHPECRANKPLSDPCFERGNYFASRAEADAMIAKLNAVLKGADVIEIPSEEDAEFESNKLLGLSGHDEDEFTEKAYLDGFADCLHWLKSKIAK